MPDVVIVETEAPAPAVIPVPVVETPVAETPAVESPPTVALELGQVMAKVEILEREFPTLKSQAEEAGRVAQSAHDRITSLEKPPETESESVAVPEEAKAEPEAPKAKRGGLMRFLLG